MAEGERHVRSHTAKPPLSNQFSGGGGNRLLVETLISNKQATTIRMRSVTMISVLSHNEQFKIVHPFYVRVTASRWFNCACAE